MSRSEYLDRLKAKDPEAWDKRMAEVNAWFEREKSFDYDAPLIVQSAVDQALENLEVVEDEWFRSYPLYDPEKVYELLVRITCPPPCVGFVNDTGWHKLCLDNADKAFEALFGAKRFKKFKDG